MLANASVWVTVYNPLPLGNKAKAPVDALSAAMAASGHPRVKVTLKSTQPVQVEYPGLMEMLVAVNVTTPVPGVR